MPPDQEYREIAHGYAGAILAQSPTTVIKKALHPHLNQNIEHDFLTAQRVSRAFAHFNLHHLSLDSLSLDSLRIADDSEAASTDVSMTDAVEQVGDTQKGETGKAMGLYKGRVVLPRLPVYYRLHAIDAAVAANQRQDRGLDADWWHHVSPRLPYHRREPTYCFSMERVPPLPVHWREQILRLYCPPELIESVKTSWEYQNMLCRLYLGRERRGGEGGGERTKRFFGVRNYPLHLDQALEVFGEERCRAWAGSIGAAYAVMHAAGTDAFDVEFVLGGSSVSTSPAITEEEPTLWLIDFDKCRNTLHCVDEERREERATQLASAIEENDPYAPKVDVRLGLEKRVVHAFVATYNRVWRGLGGEQGRSVMIELIELRRRVVEERKAKEARERGHPCGCQPCRTLFGKLAD